MHQGPGAPFERDTFRLAGPLLAVLLLMSYPWLAPTLQARFVGGVPLVLIYFFVVWAIAIALSAAMRAEG